MKKGLLILLFLLSVIISNAQELTWYKDAAKAIEISNKTNKPLMLFFTGSDWCGWCIRLQKEVFVEADFKKWASENVVLLELDFPRRSQQEEQLRNQNYQIQQAFQVRGYPTVWFAKAKNNNGKINFLPIGSTGYVAGGSQKWIESANTILKKNK